jgi:hypothetical protein
MGKMLDRRRVGCSRRRCSSRRPTSLPSAQKALRDRRQLFCEACHSDPFIARIFITRKAASYAARRCTRGIGFFIACHKSYCICSPNQRSALVPSPFDRRTAISALTPALPFKTADKDWRVTPSRVATSIKVSVSGKYSRNTSPGCGGLCILLILTSVIVQVVNQLGIRTDKSKNDAPNSIHGNRVVAAKIAL